MSSGNVDDVTRQICYVMWWLLGHGGGFYSEEIFPFHKKLHNNYVVGKCHWSLFLTQEETYRSSGSRKGWTTASWMCLQCFFKWKITRCGTACTSPVYVSSAPGVPLFNKWAHGTTNKGPRQLCWKSSDFSYLICSLVEIIKAGVSALARALMKTRENSVVEIKFTNYVLSGFSKVFSLAARQ